tara:strand:- start:2757 stop:4181 length:1425 start_codon:yes stop_codon:yes gene_type:complete
MANYFTENFQSAIAGGNLSNVTTADASHSTSGTNYLPTDWVKFSDLTADTNGTTIGTAFSGTQLGPALQSQSWGNQTTDSNFRDNQWVIFTDGTGSNNTGPLGGRNPVNNGHLTTTGNDKYLGWEASAINGSNFGDSTTRNRGLGLIRTKAIDLTSVSSTEVLTLTGYFHAYGIAIGAFGVACTTSSNNASSASEAFTGSGFTGFTNNTGDGLGGGGCDIDYASGNSSTINVYNKKRIVGQQQTSNSATWNPFSVDLTGAGGQTVYIYFLYESMNQLSYKWDETNSYTGSEYWKGDFCITDLSLDDSVIPDTDYEGKIFNIAGSSIENIYGQDLDEGDKVIGSDGVNTAVTTKVFNFTNSFTGTGSLSGTANFRLRTTSTWTTFASVNLATAGNSFSVSVPENIVDSAYATGNNISFSFPNPAGDYTLESFSETITPANAVHNYYSHSFGSSSYILGYNRTTPSTTNFTLNWES